MIETAIIVVPTLWKRKDERRLAMDPWEQKAHLDYALHKEHYRVKQMIVYEYRKVLYTQYVLEKEVTDGNNSI